MIPGLLAENRPGNRVAPLMQTFSRLRLIVAILHIHAEDSDPIPEAVIFDAVIRLDNRGDIPLAGACFWELLMLAVIGVIVESLVFGCGCGELW